jgi:uncharacterized protein (TIGR03437 family)
MFHHYIRIALGSLFVLSLIISRPLVERANAQISCGQNVDVIPANPTANDNVSIRLSGQWSDACVPGSPVVTVAGGEIRINTSRSGQVCAQVITPWSLTVSIGRLAARTYQVIATHSYPGGQCELGRRSFTVSAVNQPVTIVDHRMSGGPVSTTICVAPPARYSFAPTDAQAYQWTSFSGVRAGDVVRRDFISPNGSPFFTSSDVFPSNGSYCAWDSIPIAGGPAASLPGNWQVRVFYNGALILTENFSITVPDNPPPTLAALSPNSVMAGGPSFTLALTGSNFINSSVVRWNGGVRATTFVSGTQLLAVISAGDIAFAGAASLTVFNPAPGGGVSNALGFTIINNCTYAIAPTSQSFNSFGGAGSVSVTTGNNCNWTASSNANWITIASGGSGAGSGAVNFSVGANLNSSARTGTMTIAGQTFTVTQAPPDQPPTGAAVIIDGTDANEHGGVSGGRNVRGWLYMQKALENLAGRVSTAATKVVVDLGTENGEDARRAIVSAFNLSSLPGAGWTLTHVDGAANITNWLASLSTANTGILYIPTYNQCGGAPGNPGCEGDLEPDEMAAINAQAGRIAGFINGSGGALFAMGESNAGTRTGAWGWLQALFPGLNAVDEGAATDITLTPDGREAFPGLASTALVLTGNESWHNHFTGNLGTLKVLATAPDANNVKRNVIIGGVGIIVNPPPCPAIASFSPTSGSAGATIAIAGANFTGVNSVKFANNIAATFTINSDMQITATVPNGAVTGPITISKPGCPDVQSNANFTIVGPPPSRTVRVVCGTASPGGTAMIPIVLDSQGDENALGFSVNFDPAILGNPRVALGGDAAGAILNMNSGQAAQGRLGIALALPSGQRFAAGARQIIVVTFTVANTSATGTRIDFGDAPIGRQVSNANAQLLNAGYQGCVLAIDSGTPPGYEADVTPRPSGKNNGTIAITDWVQVGRFTAGLDTPSSGGGGGEFQRADCAPRDTKGDGQLSITDWVQAGRYVAGLDAPQSAGGPTSATALFGNPAVAQAKAERAHGRELRVVNATFARGQESIVAIEMEAGGDENAIGFSLNFDPSVVRFVSAAAGDGMADALVIANNNQVAAGRVGIAIALPAGRKVNAGKRSIVNLRFASLMSSTATTTAIAFDDQPIRRQVSGAEANALAAEYINGSITIRNAVANVSAASFKADLAAESIVAAFGSALATTTAVATELPLPTQLAGTTVRVKDSAGIERLAAIFFVAPAQVNYLMPAGTATGLATVTITSGDGAVSVGTINLTSVAPSLFSANADGQGVATATLLRVKADGSQIYEPVSRYDDARKKFVAVPVDLGPESDQVFLIPFGTGLRNRSSLAAVSATIGGLPAQVLYAGSQGALAGVDQINLRLPRGLAGRGLVDLLVTADGKTANTVQVSVR